MGLLDFFRRRGDSETSGGAESAPEERAHGAGVPPGSAAEGPPVGVSDPGALGGEDAGDVVAAEEDVEGASETDPPRR